MNILTVHESMCPSRVLLKYKDLKELAFSKYNVVIIKPKLPCLLLIIISEEQRRFSAQFAWLRFVPNYTNYFNLQKKVFQDSQCISQAKQGRGGPEPAGSEALQQRIPEPGSWLLTQGRQPHLMEALIAMVYGINFAQVNRESFKNMYFDIIEEMLFSVLMSNTRDNWWRFLSP